jgi:DNA repair protein RadA/Sms
MAKIRTVYFCQNCGTESAKWVGKCPSCSEWNTFVEEIVKPEDKKGIPGSSGKKTPVRPKLLKDVSIENRPRIDMKDTELNRVLGGGLVPGSLTLIAGEPGIGKSTLLLQIALLLPKVATLYISGEESPEQIRMRAERVGPLHDNFVVLCETDTAAVFPLLREIEPQLVIVDSIQTLSSPFVESGSGSISQIRQCTSELMKYAKESGVPVILVGHITKEGTIAGPKVLEHMVDTVLQFEGDRNHLYRLLRAVKNRFGSTNELGIYEMSGIGLRPVQNPSEVLLSEHDENVSGVALAATIEGLRPMLIEIQALVSTAVYGTPQRSTTGFDTRRLNMLLAVLEKRAGFSLAIRDVFLNITGGIRVEDPAIDLAVIAAIYSSSRDLPVPESTAFAGEVGLSGEVRAVTRVEQRIREAEKMGLRQICISGFTKGIIQTDFSIKIVKIQKVEELISKLFL